MTAAGAKAPVAFLRGDFRGGVDKVDTMDAMDKVDWVTYGVAEPGLRSM